MSHPLLNAFWIMLWFFLWIMWLMLLFRVITDVFADKSLSGWAKAGWLVFVFVLPFLGVFVYLITRGRGMEERTAERAEAGRQAMDDYIREAAGTSNAHPADELVKLADLKANGTLTEDEFQQAKRKILAA